VIHVRLVRLLDPFLWMLQQGTEIVLVLAQVDLHTLHTRTKLPTVEARWITLPDGPACRYVARPVLERKHWFHLEFWT